MSDLYKYGAALHLYKAITKRAVVDFAVGADWTPAAGDVKISKDGGAAANVTNLPVAIAMGNTAMWDFSLTAAEMTGAKIRITVSDSATKAVEDKMFEIDTYGNASAQHAMDLSDGVRAGLAALSTSPPLPRITGTAQNGAGSTIVLANGTTSLQCCAGDIIVLTGGTGAGQSNYVSSFDPSSAIATMIAAWPTTNPDSSSTYEILKVGGGVPASISDFWGNDEAPVRSLTQRADANITAVAGLSIAGSGSVSAPWGPAP